MYKKALEFAWKAHEGQVRKYNGLPYILHPIRVANDVMEARTRFGGYIKEYQKAALLHDVCEDCNITKNIISDEFGEIVANIVWSLTSYSKQIKSTSNRKQRKQLDRNYLSQQSLETKFIKLLDRLDNLNEVPIGEDFGKIYAEESLELLEVLCQSDLHLPTHRDYITEYNFRCRQLLGEV